MKEGFFKFFFPDTRTPLNFISSLNIFRLCSSVTTVSTILTIKLISTIQIFLGRKLSQVIRDRNIVVFVGKKVVAFQSIPKDFRMYLWGPVCYSIEAQQYQSQRPYPQPPPSSAGNEWKWSHGKSGWICRSVPKTFCENTTHIQEWWRYNHWLP